MYFRRSFFAIWVPARAACCIEGDAGAPVELDEVMELEEVLPVIWDELAPEARAVIEKQGVVYTDEEGDLVTSIVNNKDCVFTCYDEKGCCYCAIEKAYREGKTDFYKPLCIDICIRCILFNEIAARAYVFTHQHGEDIVGFGCILKMHLFQHTVFRIHGCFPQLFRRSFHPNLCSVVCGLHFPNRRRKCR